jgi:hypothetical protein
LFEHHRFDAFDINYNSGGANMFRHRLLSDYRARHSSNQEYSLAGSTEKPGAIIRNQTADALFNETQAHKY